MADFNWSGGYMNWKARYSAPHYLSESALTRIGDPLAFIPWKNREKVAALLRRLHDLRLFTESEAVSEIVTDLVDLLE